MAARLANHLTHSQPPRAQRSWFRQLLAEPAGLLGLLLVAAMTLVAIAAPQLATYDPYAQNWSARLAPPMTENPGGSLYLLGTDGLGRDLYSRLLYGARVSLTVGLLAVVIRGSMGSLIGLLAGYHGGWIDSVLMRLADIQLAIPFLVLAIAVMAIIGPGFRNTILVLGVTGWVTYGRVVRSEVLSIREEDYIDAAHSIGLPSRKVITNHILPNVSASIIVLSTLEVAQMIIAEAALSFLGLGIQPPTPSWGGMVASGRDVLYVNWWISTLPGIAIFVTVLGINLFGDWLRDFLDPTLRRGRG